MVTKELDYFKGNAAETEASVAIKGEIFPEQSVGKWQVKIKWTTTDIRVGLPQWVDYSQGCSAAQAEWNRFMKQLR